VQRRCIYFVFTLISWIFMKNSCFVFFAAIHYALLTWCFLWYFVGGGGGLGQVEGVEVVSAEQ
jgi:hypothetical protein